MIVERKPSIPHAEVERILQRKILVRLAGPIGESRQRREHPDSTQREIVAYHEASHAVLAEFLKFYVLEVSTVPQFEKLDECGYGSDGHVLLSAFPSHTQESAATGVRLSDRAYVASACQLFTGINWRRTLEMVHTLKAQAVGLVDVCWPRITAVADQLLHDGSLDREQLEAIIDRAA